MANIPISALSEATKLKLSNLNDEKVIPTDDGLPRFWKGIAHLIGLNMTETRQIENKTDPMATLLNVWGPNGTVDQLRTFLALIDRYDVLDDCQQLIEADIAVFSRKEQIRSEHSIISTNHSVYTVDDVIVNGDSGEISEQHYDAYLLYAEEDADFAAEIIRRMAEKNLQLCYRERALIGGAQFEHDVVMKLIERCQRLLVIFSPAFLQSRFNNFFVSFAQARGIDQRTRKVIPIVYKTCEIPLELTYYFRLEYTRSGPLWDFWERLAKSLMAPDPLPSSSGGRSPSWSSNSREDSSPYFISHSSSTASFESSSSSPPQPKTKNPFKNLASSISNRMSGKKGKSGKKDINESS